MTGKAQRILTFFTLLIVSLTFFFWGLIQARSFLLPLSVACLLAMIILPVCRWFEGKGLKRGWASFLSVLIIIFFFGALVGVVAAQVKSLTDDWPQIKEKIEPKIEQLQQYIAQKTGLSVQEQKQKISSSVPGVASGSEAQSDSTKNSSPTDSAQTNLPPSQNQTSTQGQEEKAQNESSSASSSLLSSAGSVISQFFSTLGTLLLIFVYIFFFLMYRRKFKLSILKMVPDDRQEHAKKVISNSTRVSQKYLFGRILLILFLTVLYAIGLSVSGVRNAILVSMLAAVLSLIPYIGNMIGYGVAIILAFISDGGFGGAIGVSITFAITQFVESYILEPYVVGDQVDLNPVFTIIVVVLGGAIWGIVGMLIAIPALGIVKVVFDNVTVLQPVGYLFGEEDTEDDEQDSDNIFKKTKRWAMNKFH
uniref:AI-2E family transporter n=1 Tax=Roseihalotalea indica TaxID=2867963 RepID=A0AA49GN18_9BACT|nr:AI-2E family transporter [Tunicatimonas sp. TK19036]